MSISEKIIGWLAVPQCLGCGLEGTALCVGCAATEITTYGERCWRCGALSPMSRTCRSCQSFGGPRRVWLTTNYEGLASRLVAAYKFKHQRYMAPAIAQLMSSTLQQMLTNGLMVRANYLVVPLPTATSRRRQRGFDHVAGLAKAMALQLQLPYATVLGRLGQARQVGAWREARLRQPLDKYFVRRPGLVSGRNILLIDDVVTTGATLRAATKALRSAGAKHVDALAFARRL